MAYLAVHDKKTPDEEFCTLFLLLEAQVYDGRNFVKKALNWALRQIGKRNRTLNQAALNLARQIQLQGTKSARWIAADALRELQDPKVQERLQKKK